AIATEELEHVRAAAHKIKGTSRSLTFDKLAEKALALEKTAASGKELPETSTPAEFEEERKRVLSEIHRLAGEIVDEFHYVKTLI
ncbi:MAG: Hpt domain-containing protein, partial [Cyclonatronaceae bacterium]